jgi:hypothetical protein
MERERTVGEWEKPRLELHDEAVRVRLLLRRPLSPAVDTDRWVRNVYRGKFPAAGLKDGWKSPPYLRRPFLALLALAGGSDREPASTPSSIAAAWHASSMVLLRFALVPALQPTHTVPMSHSIPNLTVPTYVHLRPGAGPSLRSRSAAPAANGRLSHATGLRCPRLDPVHVMWAWDQWTLGQRGHLDMQLQLLLPDNLVEFLVNPKESGRMLKRW